MARIIDTHTHWYPTRVFDELSARRNAHLGINENTRGWQASVPTSAVLHADDMSWHDLDTQFERMDKVGHEVEMVSWIAQPAAFFTEVPAEVGHELADAWNDEMAAAQRKYAGRFWGTAAVPLTDTEMSIGVLDRAMKAGLVGVNLPSIIGKGDCIDAVHLEPFYARAAEHGAILYVHPQDAAFPEILGGYNGALFASIGRVMDVSVAALRLVLSGIMERHPGLTIYVSHTAGALPYQAGRLDKNCRNAKLPLPASAYLKRMYTDIVSPHVAGMKFAIEYFGVDHILYGSDFPCWDPEAALRLFEEIDLSAADKTKILSGNARRLFGLAEPAQRTNEIAAVA